MKTKFVVLFALVLTACGHTLQSPDAPVVSPLHKANECPKKIEGQWDYQYQANDGSSLDQKQLYFKYAFNNEEIMLYDSREGGDPWWIDGITHETEDGKTVMGYCSDQKITLQINENGRVSQVVYDFADGQTGQVHISTDGASAASTASIKKVPFDTSDFPTNLSALGTAE